MDNAGCYKSAQTILAIPHINRHSNIKIEHVSFSESQSGKGPADRMAGTVKAHVNRYIDQDNQAKTPLELLEAIASGNGVRGVSAYLVNTIADENQQTVSLPGIFSLHDFSFLDQHITTWNFYQVGIGATVDKVRYQNFEPQQFLQVQQSRHQNSRQKPTGAALFHLLGSRHKDTSATSEQATFATEEESESSDIIKGKLGHIFQCPLETCKKTFTYFKNLQKHIEIGMLT